MMYNITNIRLIYTHAESDGGYNYVNIFHQELILGVGTHLRVKACMIWQRFYAV